MKLILDLVDKQNHFQSLLFLSPNTTTLLILYCYFSISQQQIVFYIQFQI